MAGLTRRIMITGLCSALAGIGLDRWILRPGEKAGPRFPKFDSFASARGKTINDASGLEPTEIDQLVFYNAQIDSAFIHRLRGMVRNCGERGVAMIASTTRHSLGGQSLPENGVAVSLVQDWIEPHPASRTYRVAAGVRWANVIAALDKIGYSPKVMQSNNDFGVASSFSVNAHGWPAPYSGCGGTVRAIKMMFADGVIRTCSRTENTEAYRHAMGGYGLFGVITELELEMVPNVRLDPAYEAVPGQDLGMRIAEELAVDPSIQLAYGVFDISPDNFLRDGLFVSFRASENQKELPPVASPGLWRSAAADLFRAQTGADAAKGLNWWSQTTLEPLFGGVVTRNSLLNESVLVSSDDNPDRTDILQEYFIAPKRFAEFVKACAEVVPASYQRLIKAEARYVDADAESLLSYAPEPRIGMTLMFSQEMTERGEADMRRMTHVLIDRALALGGSYYLPYRPHATIDQMLQAYPNVRDFVAFKRSLDPKLVFRNRIWDRYFSKI